MVALKKNLKQQNDDLFNTGCPLENGEVVDCSECRQYCRTCEGKGVV